jgi:putative hydrolase of the HAD superfamily
VGLANIQFSEGKEHSHSWVILDLDDTLVDTSDIYFHAREKFLKQIVSIGFRRSEILETFERIETNNIRLLGIFPDRYTQSMMEAYRKLCSKNGTKRSKQMEQLIQKIGGTVANTVPKPLPGAISLMRWLYENSFVVLITRGVDQHQRMKIDATGLKQYIHKCFIVKKKTASVLKSIAKKLGRDIKSAWIVGDSIRSDINPGIRAGARCILYEYRHNKYYWRQEYGKEPAGEYFLAKTLEDVLQIIQRPDQWEKHRTRLFRRPTNLRLGQVGPE